MKESHLHNGELTIWSQLVLMSKFPASYGIRGFISMFTRARHLSLSWAMWIESSVVYLNF